MVQGSNETWTFERELQTLLDYTQQIFSGWSIKAIFALIFASATGLLTYYSDTFNVDSRLVWLLVIAMITDTFLGTVQAMVTGWFDARRLRKIVPKFVTYGIFLIVAGCLCLGIQLAIGMIGNELLAIFIGYFAATEWISVCKNLERMGVKLPYPLPELISAVYKRMHREVDCGIKKLEGDDLGDASLITPEEDADDVDES